jgi:hypothetical protein
LTILLFSSFVTLNKLFKFVKLQFPSWALVALVYNSSSWEAELRRINDLNLRPAWENSSLDPISKITGANGLESYVVPTV